MGANSYKEQILSLKNRKTAILNSQNIRMLQTHVNNDIYNKYFLIHNIIRTYCFDSYNDFAHFPTSWQAVQDILFSIIVL